MEPEVRPEAIPDRLKAVPHWVNWKWEERPGQARPTKPPFNPGGFRASHSRPNTWTGFETALRALRRRCSPFAGLGFVFAADDPFGGVDLDGCVDPETGEVAEWAREILKRLPSYTEVSPSGTGLKIFLEGRLPGPGKKRTGFGPDGKGAVEVYDRLRFFTVTGRHHPDSPREVRDLGREFGALYHAVFPEEEAAPAAVPTPVPLAVDDAELLRRAGRAKDGAKFLSLWNGELAGHRGDRSRADLALCGLLLFWTGGDLARADRLFRQSGLMRPKWDERRGSETYGERTLKLALSRRREFYDPERGQRERRPEGGQPPVEGAAPGKETKVKAGRPGREENRATSLSKLADEMGIELFHTPDRECYGTVPVDRHRETWRVKGMEFRGLLEREYYRRTGRAVGGQAMQDAVNLLMSRAFFDGPELPVYTRVAECDGALYLNLADAAWQCVRVTGGGWEVLSEAPVRFRKAKGMLPLPPPERGGSVDLLRGLLNVAEEDWPLLVGWLVGALRARGPYPVAQLQGEQGSAKSTTARVLRALIDPNVAPLRAEPKDARDLAIGAKNGWVVAYDNLSTVYPWLSDALCRLATGGGLSTRELWTDDGEVLFDAQRPAILNGIAGVSGRSDLLDRSLLLTLPAIPEERRRTEAEFWREFERVRPLVLGALLDAVAAGLSRVDQVRLPRLPRMADFALWVTACETGLGWAEGTFLSAYDRNRREANSLALESCAIGETLLALVRGQEGGVWDGTASELLQALGEAGGERVRERKDWPKNARSLSVALRRIAPNLRAEGVEREDLPREGERRPLRLRAVGAGDANGDANGGSGDANAGGGDANGVTGGLFTPAGDATGGGDASSALLSPAYIPSEETRGEEWEEARREPEEEWAELASLFGLPPEDFRPPEPEEDPRVEQERRRAWNERIFVRLQKRNWGRLQVEGLGDLGPGEVVWRCWVVAALPYKLERLEQALDAEEC